ncbi:MAG: hypothetical protein DRI81_13190 [Chloroflexi bacterium]|nr:MAG: hypothetical protein DRI81_13190 [Chloroflexota bacterium]
MSWLLRYADQVFGVPAPEDIQRYLGFPDACYLGYAVQKETRARAASGGVVSALLIYLLEQDIIQGALVSRTVVEGGRIQARPFIAHSREEVLAAQSSIYIEFPWLREARPLLEETEETLAIVGLPCHVRALRRLETRNPALEHKIRLHVGLICGRSSSKKLLLNVLARKGIPEEKVMDIRFREGHWRGRMHIWLRDGSEITFPFQDFSLYRNLHFYCERRCLHCADPLGEQADIVCGDAWLSELRKQPIKHSLIISRTDQTTCWVQEMMEQRLLAVGDAPPETVFRAQRRGLIPARRGKEAKSRIGRLLGYRVRSQGAWRSRWNDYLMAAIVLLNHRWSHNRKLSPLIFHIPKPFLRLYVLVLSLLKQF